MTHQLLHMPTLLGVSVLVIAFSGFLLLLARNSDDGTHALAIWGGAILTGAGGLLAELTRKVLESALEGELTDGASPLIVDTGCYAAVVSVVDRCS